MEKTEELVAILKKPASNESKKEFFKKAFPEGLGAYNIDDKDAQALYILLKANVDIEELKADWKNMAKIKEVKLKALLNSFDIDLNKIID